MKKILLLVCVLLLSTICSSCATANTAAPTQPYSTVEIVVTETEVIETKEGFYYKHLWNTALATFHPVYHEGQYRVGTDMDAGEYVLIATDTGFYPYFAVTIDANASETLVSGNLNVAISLMVNNGEYLTLQGCAAIPAQDFRAIYRLDGSEEGVMLFVGHDIDEGEYKIAAVEGGLAYYAIYDNARQSSPLSSGNFTATSYVNVEDGQYLLLFQSIIDSRISSATKTPMASPTPTPTSIALQSTSDFDLAALSKFADTYKMSYDEWTDMFRAYPTRNLIASTGVGSIYFNFQIEEGQAYIMPYYRVPKGTEAKELKFMSDSKMYTLQNVDSGATSSGDIYYYFFLNAAGYETGLF